MMFLIPHSILSNVSIQYLKSMKLNSSLSLLRADIDDDPPLDLNHHGLVVPSVV